MQQQIANESAGAPSGDATAAAPAPRVTPGPIPVPPRDDAERRARAAAALGKGVKLVDLTPVGAGDHYALGLASAVRDGKPASPHLVLVDVATPKGLLVGDHDFGDEPGAGPITGLGRAFYLDASPGEPVALVELFKGDGEHDSPLGVCGWTLGARRLGFLCAPRLTPDSRFDVHQGQLVESWSVDAVGVQIASRAGTRSGRQLRFADGRWQETDSFRCLGRPLPEAFKRAGTQTLLAWQQDTVRRLTKAATRSAELLDTDVATARLQDALATDGCAPETWRILGRLEFDAGRPQAAATLAVAVALAPADDGALLDLADALAVLDVAKPQQRDSWRSTVAILGARGPTRAWLEGGSGNAPRALAATLYRTFLARSATGNAWLEPKRRKVEQKLEALDVKDRGQR